MIKSNLKGIYHTDKDKPLQILAGHQGQSLLITESVKIQSIKQFSLLS